MLNIINKPKYVTEQLLEEIKKYSLEYFDKKISLKELKFKNYFSSSKVSCYSIALFEAGEEVITIDIAILKQNVNFYDFNWQYDFSRKERYEIDNCNLAAFAYASKLLERY